MNSIVLKDSFGRAIRDLRISITDRCNFRCFYCMPTEAMEWKPKPEILTYEEIITLAEVFVSLGVNKLRVTGGEPMLFDPLEELANQLITLGHHVTIETAGTIDRFIPGAFMSISPKLANSTPSVDDISPDWVKRHEQTRLQPEVLRSWLEHCDYQLKFVISRQADIEEAAAVVDSIGIPVAPERVLLMPEGVSMEAMRERYDLLVDTCKARGWRFSPRLHIDLFGNKRGT